MSQYYSKISRYFRQSLIDADRLCPQDKDIISVLGPDKKQDPRNNYLALDHTVWMEGRISSDLAEEIIEARQPENKPPLQQLEIMLFPRVDHLIYQGGARDKRKRDVLLPLAVFVNLKRSGVLTPADKAPWIPRIWIGPTQSASLPITEMALIDNFFTQHPFDGIETWWQLTAYCARLLYHAVGVPYPEPTGQRSAALIRTLSISQEYDLGPQCLLQLTAPIVGVTINLLKVIDFLLDRKRFPVLYQAYSNHQDAKRAPYSNQHAMSKLAKRHVGQMSGEFPLSIKQRNALHYLVEQKHGEILAVNGPPGTGKTTLLRSVVANLWTQAALDEREPPLVVVSSNNNQAVTNILESFARIDETGLDERLIGRWLPEVDSYGLYFCSSVKANQKNPYRYAGPRGEGCMAAWQTQAFVTQAEAYFLAKMSQWQQDECKNVDDALVVLHNEMLVVEKQIQYGLACLDAWQSAVNVIVENDGSVESLKAIIAERSNTLSEKIGDYEQEKAILDAIYELWASRKWWISLLMWLPPIRKQEVRKTARLLNQWDRAFTIHSHEDDAVENALTEKLIDMRSQISQLQHQVTESESRLNDLLLQQEKLEEWLAPGENLKLLGKTIPDLVAELNDRYYRFRLFKLATHYFEARWLKETKVFVESKDEDKKSPFKLLRKLRRYAKLTPCFVSTFFMTPSTFLAGEYIDKTWMDLPQLEEIDLLIVDEAGQALPDVSAASFALAKKALVVGDTDQIEPIWRIPASVDRSNLALFDLLSDEYDYEQWLASGLLTSSGNVMRLAQRQCLYHQFEQLQRGLYLTEHRRCLNEIVGYCNDLVYRGLLEPLRGDAKHELPWGVMALVPVYSPSRSFGGSRGNQGEARAIANWLMNQYQTIVAYARKQDKKFEHIQDAVVLSQTVGIVTPFSKQAVLIRSELKKVGIRGLTVGTVHSLQGDERLVVLFSSVYGENNKDSGKFYDISPNMLNVAVSRAKDVFIVFGDPTVFGATAAGSPSGLLRKRLKLANDVPSSEVNEESASHLVLEL